MRIGGAFRNLGAALLPLPLMAAAHFLGPALLAQSKIEANSSFEALAGAANQAREDNRLDAAVVLYKKALALRPAWAEGWWYLGTLLYDREAYADGAVALQKALTLSPQSGVGAVMLGLCEAKLGRDREALRHIEKGWTLGIGHDADLRKVVLYTRGTLLLGAGEFGRAQDALDLLAREGDAQEELIVALGLATLGITPQKLAAADSATREMVRRAGWAEHFAARSEIEPAMREYSSLAADYRTIHNVQFAYGRFLVASHQDDKAVEAFQHEIENTPNHLLARLGIAGIKLIGDPAAGLPYAEQAVKLAPGLSEAHYLLGALLLNSGQAKKAIVELETAEQLDPRAAKIYFALANAYAQVNRKQDAARARAKFARLNSQSTGKPEAEGKDEKHE